MKPITYHPIGIIRTQYTQTGQMPIQAALAENSMMAVAELNDTFSEGLTDLDGFSHIILVYHFHKAAAPALMQKPFLDDAKHGIFSIRSPHRPNPIGISIVELVKVEGNNVYFNHADMLDETPLLDIKPFVPVFDHRDASRCGWIEHALLNNDRLKGSETNETN
jgi:tRNA-Thr(GGU) m(6)t(6)A37 methyltransferase TsaA